MDWAWRWWPRASSAPGSCALLGQCGPITVQGFLLAAPVEMQIAAQTAEGAALLARVAAAEPDTRG